MGEPVEEITPGATRKAVNVIDDSVRELEDDIEKLGDFQDAVEDFQPTGRSKNRGPEPVALDQGEADTDKVLELYRENFFSEHATPDQVEVYAEKFGLSTLAADFLDELMGVANLSDQEKIQKVKFLDGSNAMNDNYIREVVSLAEYPKAIRRETIDDTGVERESLVKYSREINELENQVLKLNSENPLPMDVDNALYVLEELEDIEERVEQLKNRREHELRRRPDILDGYFEKNLKKFYDGEEFEEPVLYDLERLEDAVNEAYDNIVI